METENSRSGTSNYLPAWKMPISKSYSSAIGEKSTSESGSSSPEEDNKSFSVDIIKRQGILDAEDEDQLIQILLPCIICNRTFSPEALERHNKVCTKVNVKTPYKPERGKFKSDEQRKKGTKAEYFIPPPSFDSPDDNRLSCLSRGSRNRSSLRGTSCTTRSTLSTESLHLHHPVHGTAANLNISPANPTLFRRQRSFSQTRGERASSKPPSEYPYDDHSEFESNSEESQTIPDTNLPSYAKPIAPTDECPFCNRHFGLKAFDRHVEYCKEKYVKRQYEIQPVPKDRIEAMERQEVRTKYRPMKSSSSCSSLRSMSPGKDFTSMAFKLFGGLRRTGGSNNLYNNQLTNNFKKSNESLTNSCYGDYTRGIRRPSPSPARHDVHGNVGGNSMSVTNKINNLLSKTFHLNQNSNNNTVNPMRVNTTSNIPKLAKSSDNLTMAGGGGTPTMYNHVPGSGYGQQSNNNFTRNSRSRSSLNKNFFRSKRTEPEGTESTSSTSNASSYPLIITPMTFYAKTSKALLNPAHHQEIYNPNGSTLHNQETSYDPYEMAAKQLEELLKAQPINKNVNKRTARKLGLEKAFESVGVHSPGFNSLNPFSPSGRDGRGSQDENSLSKKSNENSFVFELASGKMDDSYWDEILQKSQSGSEQKERTNQTSSAETKSQQSDSGSVSDNNSKSRAMSHISSADSGFSRSEANDSEFEALESLVGVGHLPQQTQFPKSQTQNSLLSSKPTSLARMMHKSQSQPLHLKNQSQSFGSQQEIESPMQISPVPSSSATNATGARFCHHCGNHYPTAIAKFCPECGEKRVFKS